MNPSVFISYSSSSVFSLSFSLSLHFDSNAFISLFFVSSFSIYTNLILYLLQSYPNTGGGGPMYCYDALKHSVGADPACRLYAEDGFICNVAAAEYCMNQGFDRFEACYKAQKYGSTKDPPCPVLQYAPSAAP